MWLARFVELFPNGADGYVFDSVVNVAPQNSFDFSSWVRAHARRLARARAPSPPPTKHMHALSRQCTHTRTHARATITAPPSLCSEVAHSGAQDSHFDAVIKTMLGRCGSDPFCSSKVTSDPVAFAQQLYASVFSASSSCAGERGGGRRRRPAEGEGSRRPQASCRRYPTRPRSTC